MSRKRKIITLLSLTCAFLMLAGFIGVKVVLLPNEKLIDLKAAVELAQIGHQGNEEDLDKESKPVPTPKPINRLRRVYVTGESVRFEGITYEDPEAFQEAFLSVVIRGDKVFLVDDYAEAHFYRRMMRLLEACKEECDFVISYD